MTATEHNRHKYLQAMGFDHWLGRDAIAASQTSEVDNLASSMGASLLERASENTAKPVVNEIQAKVSGSGAELHVEEPLNKSKSVVQLDTSEILSMDWSGLELQLGQCRGCELHQRRTQAVLGAGDRQAKWLLIGEAPGEQEDLKGEPFVGRAGVLLNNMLLALGLKREQVYITNVVKCRPPGNRDPHVDEAVACHAWLQRQIELISPSIILVVGRIAARHLLQSSDPVASMRGKVHQLPSLDIPLIVTYHPAYLLRKPQEKAKVWTDLKFAISQINDQA